LLLFALRRMAADGIQDAHAAHAIFTGFGLSYRRPLLLLRILVSEVSQTARKKLSLAPCCCPRMTSDEAILLKSIADSGTDPRGAHRELQSLLQTRSCFAVLASAEAVAIAFADAGLSLA
jgi:hypothetical protein